MKSELKTHKLQNLASTGCEMENPMSFQWAFHLALLVDSLSAGNYISQQSWYLRAKKNLKWSRCAEIYL
jgi:hypothetical protein